MITIPLSNNFGSQFNISSIPLTSVPFGTDEEILQKAIEAKDCAAIESLKLSFTPLPNGELPLHYAIKKGFHGIVETLLKKGCETNQLDSHGLAPTDHALISGDSRMLALILSYKLDISQEIIFPHLDRIPKYSIMKGSEHQQEVHRHRERVNKIINSILSLCNPSSSGILEIPQGAFSRKISKISIREVCEAAFKEEYSKVEELISQGMNVDEIMPNGWTALYYAVKQGNTEAVAFLLRKGAKIDLTESSGCSALHLAAAGNNTEIVELLLQAGADPSVLDKFGRQPLTYAMTNESLATAKLLAKHILAKHISESLKVSDIEIMFCSAESRSGNRDQMGIKWNGLQWILASTIAIPILVAMVDEKHQWQARVVSCGMTVIPTFVALARTQGWKQRIGALSLFALEAMPGINMSVKFAAHAYRTWSIGKESVKIINRCWQHRHLETIRPICNGMISIVGAAVSVLGLYQAAQSKDWESQKKMFCHFFNDENQAKAIRIALSQKKNETVFYKFDCDVPSQSGLAQEASKFSDFYNFKDFKTKTFTLLSNIVGYSTPGEKVFWKKKFYGEVPVDLCKGADLKMCIQETDLRGDVHVSQSMAILGLSEGYMENDVKNAARGLSLKFHPDKSVDKDDTVFKAVGVAKTYLNNLKGNSIGTE